MSAGLKTWRVFIWGLCLIAGSSFGQSSLPLKAGKVFVDRIDIASNKNIRLPDGRWVVMGLHTRETPLTGGARTSQTVEHVSLMNENENAPLQYLSISWTTFANVNWTAQPCDSFNDIKNRPIKDTLNTNTSSLTIKCSASIYDSNFGTLNNYSSSVPLKKDLWQPIAEHRRVKPENVVDIFGYISKNRSDYVQWNLYVNPKFYGLDQASDTRYKVPANEREIIANNLLKYAAEWNKLYIQEVEKDFFPGLFQSARASVDRFNFQERVEPIKAATSSQTPTQSNVNAQPVVTQSQLPPCPAGASTYWNNCRGTHASPLGRIYSGEYRDGRFVGISGDNSVDIEIRNGMANGRGTYTLANGDKFVGELKDGRRNGLGTFTFANGNKYVGEYKDDKRNGQGTYTFANGERYFGEYKDDKRNGQGTQTFANGNKYVGEFKDDKRNGQVTATFANGERYIGEYKDDKRNGQGTQTFANGNKYVGEYKDDKRNGQVTATFANGERYVGEYKDDKRNGQGTQTFANGNKYVGEWMDDKRKGQGIEYSSNGSITKQGRWENGNVVEFFAVDPQRFPFNSSITASNTQVPVPDSVKVERDRLTAEVEAERKKRQELEQQLTSSKERERITAELDAERRKRQDVEAQLAVQSTSPETLRRNAHALVIGNGAYPGSGRLDNPVNDANAISQKLRSMGFTVTTVTDANRQKLVQSMAQFRRTAAAADISLLFYAGHGVQIFGTNYILPTDVDQTDPAQATIQGVSLNSVVENFLPGKTKLVFLDACRDNALQRTNDRSVSKGLAPISAAEGTLISYATKDGQTASDGAGAKNSPFTQALLQHLDDPADIAVVLRKVREKVMQTTRGKQQPWEYGSLTGGELVLAKIKGGR